MLVNREDVVDIPVLFTHGGCIEETLYLTGARRDFKIPGPYEPLSVYLWSVHEGFEKVGITPLKPIPEVQTFQKMRGSAMAWAKADDGINFLLYRNGYLSDEDHPNHDSDVALYHELFNGKRAGVIVHFGSKVDGIYIKDDWYNLDLSSLPTARIVVDPEKDYHPTIAYIEPLLPLDEEMLAKALPQNILFTKAVAQNKEELNRIIAALKGS